MLQMVSKPINLKKEHSTTNAKAHCTTNEIPFERLKKEGLSPLFREYIIDKINLHRVQKDCLISYDGN